jgi:hypothetical protein
MKKNSPSGSTGALTGSAKLGPAGFATAAAGFVAVSHGGIAAAAVVNTTLNVDINPNTSYSFGFGGGDQFTLSNSYGTEGLYTGTNFDEFSCGSYGPETLYCGESSVGSYSVASTSGSASGSSRMGSSFVSAGTIIGPGNTGSSGTTFASTTPATTTAEYYWYEEGYSYSCGSFGKYTCYGYDTYYDDGAVFAGYTTRGTTGGNLFLPLAAAVSGQTLYGWAELTIAGGSGSSYSMELDAIGYDTTGATVAADAPATVVPLPPSLPLLAVGAGVLAMFRQRKTCSACAA